MRKLWERFRDWLIRKLGGFTQKETAEAIDDWSERLEAADDHIARLELERDMLKKKNEELQKQLDYCNPIWPGRMVRDLVPVSVELAKAFTPDQIRYGGDQLLEMAENDIRERLGREIAFNSSCIHITHESKYPFLEETIHGRAWILVPDVKTDSSAAPSDPGEMTEEAEG